MRDECLRKPIALNESVNNCGEAAVVHELISPVTLIQVTALALLFASF